ncbi:T9SS type A sorting domain-containing protein [Nonlabens xiamenensis]|uniref:T9SS type A sorting domain-containing protein n=1 Tax=Nonlabens xiamenensis TaxID=2341043 RepID=UPI000F610583|nr:T9SS type A sorting domain-containing protein [Nonlabens xiamenensis]
MKKNYFIPLLSTAFILGCSMLASAQIIADGTYQIYNTVHNEVMTTETSMDYDANMTTPDQNDAFQLWTFTHQGNDVYKIVNSGSGNTLGINDGWCGQFGDVKANFSNSDLNVEFKVAPAAATGTYVFEIAFTNCSFGSVNMPVKAFDIQDGNPGAQIQTFDVDITNPNQQFEIVTPGSLGIADKISDNFRVFYQPQPRQVYIEALTANPQFSVQLYNLNGQLVAKDSYSLQNPATALDLNQINDGIYFLRLTQGPNTWSKKILVH